VRYPDVRTFRGAIGLQCLTRSRCQRLREVHCMTVIDMSVYWTGLPPPESQERGGVRGFSPYATLRTSCLIPFSSPSRVSSYIGNT
jgi:hypothetical protein